jgi:predicted ATPase
LAEAEARNGELKAALATLEEALDGFDRTGQRWFNAEIHRMRGEILLELNPADPALAANAFLTAVSVAQAQKTCSFELRAALALAKLYQSSGRAVDADAVLAPALEGFSPTPEMPEIEQALAFVGDIEARAQL